MDKKAGGGANFLAVGGARVRIRYERPCEGTPRAADEALAAMAAHAFAALDADARETLDI